jgi:ribosome-binding protein aMBF1 (putative translation factor)
MGESQGPAGEAVETERDRTPEEVREEIERTRVELGETVAQLAAKADVKAQAHRAVDNARATVRDKAQEVKEKAKDVKSTAGAKKEELATTAHDAMPPSADAARREMITRARQHRLALIALAAFGVGMLIGRRRA